MPAARSTKPQPRQAPRKTRRTQAERSETTIQHLTESARDLFAKRGFADTSIEDIVQAAQVTRGALYHHFESKTEVFRAVFDNEQQQLAARCFQAALTGKGDAWARLQAACLAFLDACLDPGVQQIVLIDGLTALGWEEMRKIEYGYTLAAIEGGIQLAIEQGAIARRPSGPLARLLFGSLCEAAMTVARAEDPTKAAKEVRREVRELFSALRS
jgi:AcrR family transcriptional regulator